MTIFSVFKVEFEASEICCICMKFLSWGQFAARAESKIAHYKCARKRGWKRKTRAKPKPKVVNTQPRKIKIVRNGVILES